MPDSTLARRAKSGHRLEHLVFPDGVDAGSLAGLRLQSVHDGRHLVARRRRRDVVPLHDRDATVLARVDGIDGQMHDPVQGRVQVLLGEEGAGDLTEGLCEFDFRVITHGLDRSRGCGLWSILRVACRVRLW
jgi:hypothetical protein